MGEHADGLVCLSGGLDSTTLLADLLHQNFRIEAVSFRYGSKHNQYELNAAVRVASHYKVRWTVVDLTDLFQHIKSDLLMTGGPIPEGSYTDPSMKSTVVPGRNMIFASILAGIAASRDCPTIYLGVHAGDHPIYPDCRPLFIGRMQKAIEVAAFVGEQGVALLAPYLCWSKRGILQTGLSLQVPYELTRTCYKDQLVACGVCGSCRERREAFARCQVPDPLPYTVPDGISSLPAPTRPESAPEGPVDRVQP